MVPFMNAGTGASGSVGQRVVSLGGGAGVGAQADNPSAEPTSATAEHRTIRRKPTHFNFAQYIRGLSGLSDEEWQSVRMEITRPKPAVVQSQGVSSGGCADIGFKNWKGDSPAGDCFVVGPDSGVIVDVPCCPDESGAGARVRAPGFACDNGGQEEECYAADPGCSPAAFSPVFALPPERSCWSLLVAPPADRSSLLAAFS